MTPEPPAGAGGYRPVTRAASNGSETGRRARSVTRRALTVLLCAVGPYGCDGGGARDGGAVEEAERVVRSLASAWESADTALVQELFWPQATYDDFANQVTYQGLDEIVGYVTDLHSWGDDVYVSVGRIHPTASGAVFEWVLSAVQNRPMGDRLPVATGREVVLNGVTILEVEDGLVIRAADYTDTAPLMLQLGGRIELPGGTVIQWDGER